MIIRFFLTLLAVTLIPGLAYFHMGGYDPRFETSSEITFFPEELPTEGDLVTMIKQATAQLLMEDVVARLGILGADSPRRELQAKILELQDHIIAEYDAGVPLIRITVQHEEASFAADLANAVTKSLIRYSQSRTGKDARIKQESEKREMAYYESVIQELETQIHDVAKMRGEKLLNTDELSGRLRELESERKALRERFTENDPQIDSISREIRLTKEKLEESQRLPEIHALKMELKEARRNLLDASRYHQKFRLDEAEEPALMRISALATVPKAPIGLRHPILLLVYAGLGIILGFVILWWPVAYK